MAFLSLGLGIGLLVYSIVRGGSEISLFLIIPVISSKGDLFGMIGILMILVGIIALYISSFLSKGTKSNIYDKNRRISGIHNKSKNNEVSHNSEINTIGTEGEFRAGGVVFIGPIPIIFGSDKRIARWMIVVGGVIAIIIIVIFILQFSRI